MKSAELSGVIYEKMRTERRALEKKARLEIEERMEQLNRDFEDAIVRAKDNEKTGFTAIATEAGVSRQTIYRYYLSGKERLGNQITTPQRYGVESKWDRYFSYNDDGSVRINWDGFLFKIMDDAKFNKAPFPLRARVRQQGTDWIIDECDDDSKPKMNYNKPADILWTELRRGDDVNAQILPALNEWSGK